MISFQEGRAPSLVAAALALGAALAFGAAAFFAGAFLVAVLLLEDGVSAGVASTVGAAAASTTDMVGYRAWMGMWVGES